MSCCPVEVPTLTSAVRAAATRWHPSGRPRLGCRRWPPASRPRGCPRNRGANRGSHKCLVKLSARSCQPWLPPCPVSVQGPPAGKQLVERGVWQCCRVSCQCCPRVCSKHPHTQSLPALPSVSRGSPTLPAPRTQSSKCHRCTSAEMHKWSCSQPPWLERGAPGVQVFIYHLHVDRLKVS